jgi:pantoate--beta-alanine ligase
MQIANSISVCQKALSLAAKTAKKGIALIPTMGNLHAGHLHLVDIAKQQADVIVVSIFVNPLQFGAHEDLANYPRTLEADCEKLKRAGVDIIFAPGVHEMYPNYDGVNLNQDVTIRAPAIANTLCGASRPGHFDGVTTVVAKLLNIIQPDLAVFGKKDFQQLHVMKSMVAQLNMPVEIIAGETVREASGLAMSSRNGYLTETQKKQAAFLYATLQTIAQKIQAGELDFPKLIDNAMLQLNNASWQTDYIAICNSLTLAPATIHDNAFVVLAAAKLGNTRLIDNIDFLR